MPDQEDPYQHNPYLELWTTTDQEAQALRQREYERHLHLDREYERHLNAAALWPWPSTPTTTGRQTNTTASSATLDRMYGLAYRIQRPWSTHINPAFFITPTPQPSLEDSAMTASTTTLPGSRSLLSYAVPGKVKFVVNTTSEVLFVLLGVRGCIALPANVSSLHGEPADMLAYPGSVASSWAEGRSWFNPSGWAMRDEERVHVAGRQSGYVELSRRQVVQAGVAVAQALRSYRATRVGSYMGSCIHHWAQLLNQFTTIEALMTGAPTTQYQVNQRAYHAVQRRKLGMRLNTAVQGILAEARRNPLMTLKEAYNQWESMYSEDLPGLIDELARCAEGAALTRALTGRNSNWRLRDANLLRRTQGIVNKINEYTDRAERQGLLAYNDCGHVSLVWDSHYLDGSDAHACSVCWEDRSVVRMAVDDDCYYWRSDLYYWESDEEYHVEPEPEDDYNNSDPDDNERHADRLMGYSTNTMNILTKDASFQTKSDGDFHMGLEIETVNDEYERDGRVKRVREELGSDYVIAKTDGSLPDNGLEFVTRPTSLKTHVAKLGSWEASRRGLTAWNHRSCGMHVHVDAGAFTALTLGKMIQFYNNRANVDFIRGIAGRHPSRDEQARSYAGWDLRDENDTKTPTKALKGKPAGARYSMINLCNLSRRSAIRLGLTASHGGGRYDTVEIRVFRASLRKERLLAQIEFVHAAIVFCRSASYHNLTGEAFLAWMPKHAHDYPWLAKWLNVRPHKHGVTRDTPAVLVETDAS